MDMPTLVQLATDYAAARDHLAEIADEREAAVQRIRIEAASSIRAACAETAAAERKLRAAIAEAPELFEKRRTHIAAGVKFGFRKLKGRILIDDEERTIGRIRSEFPEEQATMLIRIRESVDRNALADLTVRDLKRIGAEVAQDDDEVVVSSVGGDIDRLIKALLTEDGKNAEGVREAA